MIFFQYLQESMLFHLLFFQSEFEEGDCVEAVSIRTVMEGRSVWDVGDIRPSTLTQFTCVENNGRVRVLVANHTYVTSSRRKKHVM